MMQQLVQMALDLFDPPAPEKLEPKVPSALDGKALAATEIRANAAGSAAPLQSLLAPASFRHPQASREVVLGHAVVAYALQRARRRSIGFLVGNEGLVGIAVFMGGESTSNRAVVQSAGLAWRLPGQRLKDEFDRHGELLLLMLRYTQSLITQMAQTAVCNRHHSIDQQLCRWLLLSLDRLTGNELNMTQELIANMLGVRREGVTDAAGKLQRLGVIEYSRGHITVLDRHKLEQLSCECYAVVKKETDRLLPYVPQRQVN